MSFIGKFLGDINDIIRRKRDRQYEFRICIMQNGVNSWEMVRKDSLSWKYSDSYQVEPNCLYEVEMTLRLRLKHWLKRIKNSFIVIFREDKPKGIIYHKADRSAYTLKVVEESKALGLALKEEFKKQLSVKRIFILIVLAIIIGVVYMVLTGQVTMGPEVPMG